MQRVKTEVKNTVISLNPSVTSWSHPRDIQTLWGRFPFYLVCRLVLPGPCDISIKRLSGGDTFREWGRGDVETESRAVGDVTLIFSETFTGKTDPPSTQLWQPPCSLMETRRVCSDAADMVHQITWHMSQGITKWQLSLPVGLCKHSIFPTIMTYYALRLLFVSLLKRKDPTFRCLN